MSDNELKVVAATAIQSLFTSGKVYTPITAMDLLARVITFKPPASLFTDSSSSPRFRLTDLSRFQSILENLSHTWDRGTLSISVDNGEMTVMDLTLEPPSQASSALAPGANTRKRKRVVDEDADSAAGDADEAEDTEEFMQPTSTLGSLSKELREVYAILQKSTARGRLLAERVRLTLM